MLNERIKQLRIARNISQTELANRLTVSKQTVSNWENNNIQPSVEMLLSIARFFGVSCDFLLGLDNCKVLNVDGLSDKQIQHLNMIVSDLRGDK